MSRQIFIERTKGSYGDKSYIWQQYHAVPSFDGWNAVIGSWIVGETPAGVGIQETSTEIIGDMAFIVPHYIG